MSNLDKGQNGTENHQKRGLLPHVSQENGAIRTRINAKMSIYAEPKKAGNSHQDEFEWQIRWVLTANSHRMNGSFDAK